MPSFTLPPHGDSNEPQQAQGQQPPASTAGGFTIKADPGTSGGGYGNAPKKDFPAIPDGEMVNVEVVEVEVRDRPEWAIRSSDDETKEISFRFRVVDGAYAKRNLWGTTLPFFDYSPKCRFRIWIQAILDLDVLPEGFNLETAEVFDEKKGATKIVFPMLEGKHCRLLVGNRRNKTTGKIRDFAQDVFPAEKDRFVAEEPF